MLLSRSGVGVVGTNCGGTWVLRRVLALRLIGSRKWRSAHLTHHTVLDHSNNTMSYPIVAGPYHTKIWPEKCYGGAQLGVTL